MVVLAWPASVVARGNTCAHSPNCESRMDKQCGPFPSPNSALGFTQSGLLGPLAMRGHSFGQATGTRPGRSALPMPGIQNTHCHSCFSCSGGAAFGKASIH